MNMNIRRNQKDTRRTEMTSTDLGKKKPEDISAGQTPDDFRSIKQPDKTRKEMWTYIDTGSNNNKKQVKTIRAGPSYQNRGGKDNRNGARQDI